MTSLAEKTTGNDAMEGIGVWPGQLLSRPATGMLAESEHAAAVCLGLQCTEFWRRALAVRASAARFILLYDRQRELHYFWQRVSSSACRRVGMIAIGYAASAALEN